MVLAIPLGICPKIMRYQIMSGLRNLKVHLGLVSLRANAWSLLITQAPPLPLSNDLSYRGPTLKQLLSYTTKMNDLECQWVLVCNCKGWVYSVVSHTLGE